MVDRFEKGKKTNQAEGMIDLFAYSRVRPTSQSLRRLKPREVSVQNI